MKADLSQLPSDVLTYIVKLRTEAQEMRRQRNGARTEANQLRAELLNERRSQR